MTVKEFRKTMLYQRAKSVLFYDRNGVDISCKVLDILDNLTVLGTEHKSDGMIEVDVDYVDQIENETMDRLRPGSIVAISVKAMHDCFGEQLRNTVIDKSAKQRECDNWTEDYYYDLCNQSGGELACLDGEECRVEYVGKTGDVVFRNENGDEDVFFTLTADEVKVALCT